MSFGDIIAPGGVLVDVETSGVKSLFQDLSQIVADAAGVGARDVFEAIVERERLGSTGVGGGVAIPHAHVDGAEKIVGVFARLKEPVDFDSVDEQPADLIFLLLAPSDAGADHLKALARVARAFRRAEFRERLRTAPTVEAVTALLTEEQTAESDAA